MSPPKLKKAGDGSKQQTETTARFIWNAKVSGNYYYFSAAAILSLTTLILVLPQNTLELTKITKIWRKMQKIGRNGHNFLTPSYLC